MFCSCSVHYYFEPKFKFGFGLESEFCHILLVTLDNRHKATFDLEMGMEPNPNRTNRTRTLFLVKTNLSRSLTVDSWAPTRGAQLSAGYTVNTYSKPPLYYTLGAVAPLLPCLRTSHALGPGGPLPHADLFIARTYRLTPASRRTYGHATPASQSGSTQLKAGNLDSDLPRHSYVRQAKHN